MRNSYTMMRSVAQRVGRLAAPVARQSCVRATRAVPHAPFAVRAMSSGPYTFDLPAFKVWGGESGVACARVSLATVPPTPFRPTPWATSHCRPGVVRLLRERFTWVLPVCVCGPSDLETPTDKAEATKEQLMEYYRSMFLIRRAEITSDVEYKARTIRGFCHLYDGQEAVATGLEAGLTREDSIITTYRCHGIYLVRGGSVEQLMAEMFGFSNGGSKGKGGSMHLYNADTNFWGGAGIVGAQVPVGTGIALANKAKAKDKRCVWGGSLVRCVPASRIRHVTRTQPLDVCAAALQQHARVREHVRRRRREPRPGVGGGQHGEAVEPARHLPDREQRVRHGHLHRPALVQQRVLHVRRPRHPRPADQRHGRAGGA